MKTKRLLSMLTLMLCLVLFLSGCVNAKMSMTIHKDRSMDFCVTYLVKNTTSELGSLPDPSENSDAWKALKSRGYSLESLKNESYIGFKATKHYDSIDDVSVDVNTDSSERKQKTNVYFINFFKEDFDDTVLFRVDHKLTKDEYSAHFFFDLKNIHSEEIPSALPAEDDVSVVFTVTLPCEGSSPNYTSADGNTYTWVIPYGRETAVDFSFSLMSHNVLYGIIGLAVMLLILVLAIVLVVKKHKNVKSALQNEDLPAPKTREEAESAQKAVAAPLAADAAKPDATPTASPASQPAPAKESDVCPLCGGKLRIRTATGGAYVGKTFVVCEKYPACTYMKPAPQPAKPAAAAPQPAKPDAPAPQPAKPDAPAPQPAKPAAPAPQPAKPAAPAPRPAKPAAAAPQPVKKAPACPQCGAPLTTRKTGNGKTYAVCSRFPLCEFIKPLD